MILWFLVILGIMGNTQAAYQFDNSSLKFTLPDRWTCQLNEKTWLCSNYTDAYVVVTVMPSKKQDNTKNFKQELSQSKSIQTQDSKKIAATTKGAKLVLLNNRAWVTSLYENGELPGFNTEYFITENKQITYLVSLSVPAENFNDYLNVFEMVKKSLQIL